MSTILIATDFSRASRNASLYGLRLAKEVNADIILFNAYSVPTTAAGLNVGISRYAVKTLTGQKLKREAESLKYINLPPIETVHDEGDADDAIIKAANEKKVDFIILGMKGGGKNFRKIFGSTVTSLVKKTNIPLIVVPECAKFKILNNIVFASDAYIDADKDVRKDLRAITQLFKSKLNVVKVFNGKQKKSFRLSKTYEDLKKVACTSDTSFECRVDKDLKHALHDFIQGQHCDMLVMVPRKHDWMERLFRKSETKNMIFHIRIPLLVLPETSVKRIGVKTTLSSQDHL